MRKLSQTVAFDAALLNKYNQALPRYTPTRPRPLTDQLEARGNHIAPARSYPTRQPKQVATQVLQVFGDRIAKVLGIPVRYPLLHHSS
jgi:hypothetical protein